MAKLLTRFGRRICVLHSLEIKYPVGRSGTRFEAALLSSALASLDTTRLLAFMVQDDDGQRYPAMIDDVSPGHDPELTIVRGVVVAHG